MSFIFRARSTVVIFLYADTEILELGKRPWDGNCVHAILLHGSRLVPGKHICLEKYIFNWTKKCRWPSFLCFKYARFQIFIYKGIFYQCMFFHFSWKTMLVGAYQYLRHENRGEKRVKRKLEQGENNGATSQALLIFYQSIFHISCFALWEGSTN